MLRFRRQRVGCTSKLDACLGDAEAVDPFCAYVAENWCAATCDDDYVNQAMLDDSTDAGGTADRDADQSPAAQPAQGVVRSLCNDAGERSPRARSLHRRPGGAEASARAPYSPPMRRMGDGTLESPARQPGLPGRCAIDPARIRRSHRAIHAERGGAPPRSTVWLRHRPASRRDANSRRHGLRIDSGSLRLLPSTSALPGRKLQLTGRRAVPAREETDGRTLIASRP